MSNESNQSAYKGLLAITIAMRVNGKNRIFKGALQSESLQSLQNRLINTFSNQDFKTYDVIDVLGKIDPAFTSKVYADMPNFNQIWYSLPYLYTDILNFRSEDKNTVETKWIESKFKILSPSNNNKEDTNNTYERLKKIVFPNQFQIVHSETFDKYRELYKASYDILLLKSRRRILFVPDLAVRLYNIALPPGIITFHPSTDHQPIENNPHIKEPGIPESKTYMILPIIVLTKKITNTFRKVVAVNIVLIPINNKLQTRSVNEIEIDQLLSDHGVVKMDGPLEKYLSVNISSISDVISAIIKKISVDLNEHSINTEQVMLSKEICGSFTIDVAYTELKKFLIGEEKTPELESKLKKIVYPKLMKIGEGQDIKLRDFSINYQHIFTYASFYDPNESFLTSIMSTDDEDFPVSSLKWLFTWNLFASTSISSLKSGLFSFNRELEKSSGIESLSQLEKELIEDVNEFYDLDIAALHYKKDYEEIKKNTNLEKEYSVMRMRLQDLRNNISIKRREDNNKLIIILTLALIAIAIPKDIFSAFNLASVYPEWFIIIAITASSYMIYLYRDTIRFKKY